MPLLYQLDDQVHQVDLLAVRERVELELGDQRISASFRRIDEFSIELDIGGQKHSVIAVQDDQQLYMHWRGRTWHLRVMADSASQVNDQEGDQVLAPMPGQVVETCVEPGDAIESGQQLLIIESMKLQTQINAPNKGRVIALEYVVGDSFEKGAMLVKLEKPEADDAQD